MVTHELFRAVSDPVRRSILELLSRSKLSVSDLAAHFEVSRPAVSRHLRVLRESGLVRERRSGRERIYRLEPQALEVAADWLQSVAAGLARLPEPTGDEAEPEAEGTEAGGMAGVSEAADWRQW